MLVCKNICKSYYMNNERIDALKNINLSIKKGEFVAIIGQSGSGKSTLMNILGCLDRPTDGDYFVDGKNVGKLSLREQNILRREKIGFIFQSFNLIPSFTALENIRLPLIYRDIPVKKQKEIAQDALNAVGLGDRFDHLPSQLSGGQQQRVAVARALAMQTDVVLADEPTGNLDEKNSLEVLSLLKKLSESGKTIVMVTHDNDIAKAADRIIKITSGKIDE